MIDVKLRLSYRAIDHEFIALYKPLKVLVGYKIVIPDTMIKDKVIKNGRAKVTFPDKTSLTVSTVNLVGIELSCGQNPFTKEMEKFTVKVVLDDWNKPVIFSKSFFVYSLKSDKCQINLSKVMEVTQQVS